MKFSQSFDFLFYSEQRFTFLSGVYIYATAWSLLGLDDGDAVGPNSPPDFTVRSFFPTFFLEFIYSSEENLHKRRYLQFSNGLG